MTFLPITSAQWRAVFAHSSPLTVIGHNIGMLEQAVFPPPCGESVSFVLIGK